MSASPTCATAPRHAVWRLGRAACLPLLLSACIGCHGERSTTEESPLRPLLYTNTEQDAPLLPMEGWEMWMSNGVDPTAFPSSSDVEGSLDDDEHPLHLQSPSGLIRQSYRAARQGDLSTLLSLTLNEESLRTVARMTQRNAEIRNTQLQESMRALMAAFHPRSATDARPDGLTGLIQPTGIQLGLPRLIDGSITRDEDAAEMYATNTLSMHILGTNIDFDIQFPRLIRDTDGLWKIAESPRISTTWENFRRPGLELNPVLLNAEHAPFPFDVGNYWHYELKQIPRNTELSPDDIEPTRSLGYRDTVDRVYDATLYQIVTMRRTFADPARSPQSRHLLVTARHIYTCSNACYQNRGNLKVLLNYMSGETPLFVFSQHEEYRWGKGGRATGSIYRGEAPESDVVTVPAGSFSKATRVFPINHPDAESIYFQKRIGILREERINGDVIEQANLVQYRILR